MSAKPEIRPGTKVGREAAAELNREPQTIPTPRATAAMPPANPPAKAARKQSRPRAKKTKLQFVVPAIVLWKLRHAAADEGMSVGGLLMKWIEEPLRQHDYPTLPQWLKARGESEGDSSIAA